MDALDEPTLLRRRADEERAAAADAACMARTAHEDLAELFEERAEQVEQQGVEEEAHQAALIAELDRAGSA